MKFKISLKTSTATIKELDAGIGMLGLFKAALTTDTTAAPVVEAEPTPPKAKPPSPANGEDEATPFAIPIMKAKRGPNRTKLAVVPGAEAVEPEEIEADDPDDAPPYADGIGLKELSDALGRYSSRNGLESARHLLKKFGIARISELNSATDARKIEFLSLCPKA
jgi:hypothetical protein